MAAVSARQHHAFRILMGRHMQRAIRVAQRIVHDPSEADDIGQEAFLRVWSHAASFDRPSRGSRRGSTGSCSILRSAGTKRRPLAPIDEAADVRSDDPEPVERVIADEERRILEQAMAGLSERQRGAIALFHMEGLSGEDSAQAMNSSVKAFESLLGRARAPR